MFYVKYYPFSLEFVNLIGRKMFHVKHYLFSQKFINLIGGKMFHVKHYLFSQEFINLIGGKMFHVKHYLFSQEFINLIREKMFHVKHVRAYLEFAINISKMKQKNSWSQIGYSQSVLLLAHNIIREVPTHRFRLGGLEAGDFLNEVKEAISIIL